MGNDHSTEERSFAEALRELERLVEFCAVWLEDSDDQSDIRSAILAYLAMQHSRSDEPGI